MILIIFYLAVIGLSWIITDSEFFSEVRLLVESLDKKYDSWITYKLAYFINCIFCCSVWSALLISSFAFFTKRYDLGLLEIAALTLSAPTVAIIFNSVFSSEDD